MFEQPVVKSEKDRSRTIMLVSGFAVLVVLALIITVTSVVRRPAPTEFAEAGSAEFDGYAANVLISNVEKKTGERITGRYATIQCTVQNAGDRLLTALRLRATVLGLGGQLIREKTVTPVPNTKDELGPSQSMRVEASMEGVPDRSEISDITIELKALKLK
jgi:hypothetical protein